MLKARIAAERCLCGCEKLHIVKVEHESTLYKGDCGRMTRRYHCKEENGEQSLVSAMSSEAERLEAKEAAHQELRERIADGVKTAVTAGALSRDDVMRLVALVLGHRTAERYETMEAAAGGARAESAAAARREEQSWRPEEHAKRAARRLELRIATDLDAAWGGEASLPMALAERLIAVVMRHRRAAQDEGIEWGLAYVGEEDAR